MIEEGLALLMFKRVLGALKRQEFNTKTKRHWVNPEFTNENELNTKIKTSPHYFIFSTVQTDHLELKLSSTRVC